MRIGDLCSYAPKSQVKAGEAVDGAEYMFFTSSADEREQVVMRRCTTILANLPHLLIA